MTTTGESSANDRPIPGRAEGRAPAFLTDFDDTAAVQNVAELLLNRFGSPTWTDVRQQFRDGKLSLKEYQEITFRDVRADRPAMRHYVREHATLRPWFNELHQFCHERNIPLAVVSQGLDFYISALLERDGFGDVPIYAVDTTFQAGQISYHYNHVYPGKENQGNSKAFVVEGFQKQGYYVVYAGDGASDLEASRKADLVFAHKTLARYCDEEGIPYRPFEDFKSVLLTVRDLYVNVNGAASG
jgi:2,3-diketo-5-methylthio-1-phosphopentane phosphatase